MDQTDACPVSNGASDGESSMNRNFRAMNLSGGRDETDAGGFVDEPSPQQNRQQIWQQPQQQQQFYVKHGRRDEPDAGPIPKPETPPQPSCTNDEYKPLEEYPMEKQERGCFLIVDCQQDRRSEVDCKRLKQLARQLEFPFIRVKKVSNDDEIKELGKFLDNVGRANHDDYNCFFVVVLAYKKSLTEFTTKGGCSEIKIEKFIRPFIASNSVTLKDKPKVVIVYAPNRGVNAQPSDEVDAESEELIPNHADFYMCVCQPNDTTKVVKKLDDGREDGSHFIWNLCRAFTAFQHKYDICSIMSVVNRETIQKIVPNENEEKVKTIYWSRSQLTKSLKFPKKDGENFAMRR